MAHHGTCFALRWCRLFPRPLPGALSMDGRQPQRVDGAAYSAASCAASDVCISGGRTEDWTDWGECTSSCGSGQPQLHAKKHTPARRRKPEKKQTQASRRARGPWPCNLPTRGTSARREEKRSGKLKGACALQSSSQGFASDSRPCESLPVCPTDCEWDVRVRAIEKLSQDPQAMYVCK